MVIDAVEQGPSVAAAAETARPAEHDHAVTSITAGRVEAKTPRSCDGPSATIAREGC
jgi:hypothetical protein